MTQTRRGQPDQIRRSQSGSGGIDGGVVNNTPISHPLELGAERIYVLPTQEPHSGATVPTGALDAAIQGVHLLVGSRLQADIATYSEEADLILLPAPNAGCVQPTSFEHSQRLMADAQVAARTALGGPPAAPTCDW